MTPTKIQLAFLGLKAGHALAAQNNIIDVEDDEKIEHDTSVEPRPESRPGDGPQSPYDELSPEEKLCSVYLAREVCHSDLHVDLRDESSSERQSRVVRGEEQLAEMVAKAKAEITASFRIEENGGDEGVEDYMVMDVDGEEDLDEELLGMMRMVPGTWVE